MKHFLLFALLVGCGPTLFAQNDAASMKAKEARNIAAMRKLYADFNARNFDGFVANIDAQAVDHAAPPGTPPGPGPVREFIKMLVQAFPDMKMEPVYVTADNDVVITYLRMTGTHQGEFMGHAATNRKFDLLDADIVRFNSAGKMVEHWAVQDMCAMMNQLGLAPK
jgi:predicted ester cyclase